MRLQILLLAAGLLAPALAQNVIVRPKMTDELLVNPGMGVQTFQRYNRQALYPTLRWSEVGPEKPVEDVAHVDFPPSTVAYLRWFWWQLEPEQGRYRWDILDTAFDEARKHGQALNIRLMPYDQGNPLPEWFRNSGARRANKATDPDSDGRGGGKVWMPDSSDPLYIRHWSALVREAGRRYDGHPYLDTVDISTFGYWGEGWGPFPPDMAVQKALVDLYFEAFPRTPLLMQVDVVEALAYGTGRGAGWRADCWGDQGRPGRNFAHMYDAYPQAISQAAPEAWRHGPVSLETCGTPGSWFRGKYDLQPIFEQALRWHASTLNLKSTAIPEEWKQAFHELQKKIGYRFALRRLEYPGKVRAGAMLPVKMWWFNAGVAPVYRPYTLAVQFASAGGSAVEPVPVDVRKWLPGDATFEGNLYVDAALEPGAYRIRVAMLDPRTRKPAIKFAMEGLQPDGWYDVGGIAIQ